MPMNKVVIVVIIVSQWIQPQLYKSLLPRAKAFTTDRSFFVSKRVQQICVPSIRPKHCHKYYSSDGSSTTLAIGTGGRSPRSNREDEIRRKIRELKKKGKISNQSTPARINSPMDQYADRIKEKLGKKGGLTKSGILDKYYSSTSSNDTDGGSNRDTFSVSQTSDIDDHNEEEEEEDADLMEQVQKKLLEKRKLQAEAEAEARRALSKTNSTLELDIEDVAQAMERELAASRMNIATNVTTEEGFVSKTTTGIGGSWAKNESATSDSYRPANGGWGYFPRPKDISKAYGGGKLIGAGVSQSIEDQKRSQMQDEATKERLRRYREKVGIDVASERENKAEIKEALEIGQRAMQRGIYDVAVSALEKVTKYCSTNSKLGGKVFLELAMAYEAVGRSNEAIRIYTVLSNSRIEKVKINAKRLLVGIEAMQFMRDDLKAEGFQRKKTTQTFIDTTGLGNIAQNFDKVYNTAYVDLSRGGNFYRKLTENVVRSVREARQILLKATSSREVERPKIVQALKVYSRNFDEALRKEIDQRTLKEKPVALMNGIPIATVAEKKDGPMVAGMDKFNLGTAQQMKKNLKGEWKLQLIADKQGDRVSFFDKEVSWQSICIDKENSSAMNYQLSTPAAFFTLSQRGELNFESRRRVISRTDVKSDGTSSFLDFVGKSSASITINAEQQVMSVDSELLITRLATVEKSSQSRNSKDYFSVWRRVESGIYSSCN